MALEPDQISQGRCLETRIEQVLSGMQTYWHENPDLKSSIDYQRQKRQVLDDFKMDPISEQTAETIKPAKEKQSVFAKPLKGLALQHKSKRHI